MITSEEYKEWLHNGPLGFFLDLVTLIEALRNVAQCYPTVRGVPMKATHITKDLALVMAETMEEYVLALPAWVLEEA